MPLLQIRQLRCDTLEKEEYFIEMEGIGALHSVCYNIIPPKLEIPSDNNGDQWEYILLLNSSFFNQFQWKKLVESFSKYNKSSQKYRIITYDYSGIGKSNYKSHRITIDDFLHECETIMKYYHINEVHLFGASIGSWIGLNYVISHPEKVKSFCGYGNIAPFISDFRLLRKDRFTKIEHNLAFLPKKEDLKITKENWNEIFENFYAPTFFSHLENRSNSNKTLNILARILFPLVSGNDLLQFHDYYTYIISEMVPEGMKIEEQLGNISTNIPILLMNGELDNIAPRIMTDEIASRISHSETKIIKGLEHGSVFLGKGLNQILENYTYFLEKI